jgi:putative spermidine/putrescine transport system substrate-binding protein
MEDYEAQEQEFWRKLEEADMSRSQMLKRSFAAAAGLTILSSPTAALAARARGAKTPPLRGRGFPLKQMIAEAKREGRLNTIALPPDWANYGEIMSTFSKKYGIPITNDNPNGSSAQENEAVRSLKGDSRAPRCRRRVAVLRGGRRGGGPVREVLPVDLRDDPARDEGHARPLVRRLLGCDLDRLQPEPRLESAQDVCRPAEARVQGQGRTERKPAHIGLGHRRRVRSRSCERRQHEQRRAGNRLVPEAEAAGNFIPVGTTPQTVASGQTPISIDWDYNNLAYVKEFPAARWKVTVPTDGVYGAYYAQAVNKTAPHPWAARLWQEFLYSDQGQVLFLKG